MEKLEYTNELKEMAAYMRVKARQTADISGIELLNDEWYDVQAMNDIYLLAMDWYRAVRKEQKKQKAGINQS